MLLWILPGRCWESPIFRFYTQYPGDIDYHWQGVNAFAKRRGLYMRKLRTGDAELIMEFYGSLSKKSKKKFSPHAFTMKTAEIITSPSEIARTDVARYIAAFRRNGKEVMAGYVFLKKYDTGEPLICVSVAGKRHKKDTGYFMLEFLKGKAAAEGKTRLWLAAAMADTAAQALYAENGFVKSRVIKPAGGRIPEYEMFLKLPASARQ